VISRGQGKSAPASASYRSGTVVHVGGRSVVASASYRSGEVLHDERLGKTFDYTRKEDVLHAEILSPESAPDWVQDRSQLWNNVEASEKRKDAQLARDIIAALPRGLDGETYAKLVREFVNDNFVKRGMVADIAIHTKMASDGLDNPHMHVMLTTREVSADGFGPKNRDWNNREHIKEWRSAFEELCNRYLEEAGSDDEVSLKSYKDRGIDKIPGEHLGPNAWELEQKGEDTTKGDRNRKVKQDNVNSQTAKGYLEQLEWLAEQERDEKGQPEPKETDSAPDDPNTDSGSGDLLPMSDALPSDNNDDAGGPSAAAERGRILTAMLDAKRLSAAFAAQVKHYTQLLRTNMSALIRDDNSEVFDRYSNLRDASHELNREREKDNER